MITKYFDVVDNIPYRRCQSFISRLKAGQAFHDAVAAEDFTASERSLIMVLAPGTAMSSSASTGIGSDLEFVYSRNRRSEEAQVVWTGPHFSGLKSIRATFPVAKELIGSAKHRLIIAGYLAQADVLEKLGYRGALSRGVEVIVLLDKVDLANVDVQTLMATGASVVNCTPKNGALSKFHVKALVADATNALVTSANFTHLGHGSNVELGLWVRGQAAERIDALLMQYYMSVQRAAALAG